MKTVPMTLGVAALLVGALWIGQGLGIVHWPASSFMVDHRPWAWGGVAMMAGGAAMLLFARRV